MCLGMDWYASLKNLYFFVLLKSKDIFRWSAEFKRQSSNPQAANRKALNIKIVV